MTLQPLQAYRRWRSARLCRSAHEQIQQIVDGELPTGRQRERLERHIEECPPCDADAGTIRELKEAVARVGSDPDPAVKARLVELLDRVRAGQCEAEPDAEEPPAP